jgi:hypothetical protein
MTADKPWNKFSAFLSLGIPLEILSHATGGMRTTFGETLLANISVTVDQIYFQSS